MMESLDPLLLARERAESVELAPVVGDAADSDEREASGSGVFVGGATMVVAQLVMVAILTVNFLACR